MKTKRLHRNEWSWIHRPATGRLFIDESRGLILITADPVTLKGEENPLPPVRALHQKPSETRQPAHVQLHAMLDTLVREYRWRGTPAEQLYRSILAAVAEDLVQPFQCRYEDLRTWATGYDPKLIDFQKSPHHRDASCPICTRGHEIVLFLLDELERRQ